jgi:NADH-quinone oxidoreductase subunit G
VGALTSRDFRFKARVWYLERTPSVCGACANGCNTEIYHREGRIFRFQPRANLDVNDYWMCDAGRLSWGALQGEGRLRQVLLRAGDEFVPTPWAGAIAAVHARLEEVVREAGGGAVAFVVSAQASNEEIRLVREAAARLGATVVGCAWSPPGATGDDFLVKADKNPNSHGLRLQGLEADGAGLQRVLEAVAAGTVQALVLVRTDLTRWVDASGAAAALERARCVVVLDQDRIGAAQYADVVLPLATYAESDGTFTNHAGRVQRFHAAVAPGGEARPGWAVLGELVAGLGGSAAPTAAADVFAALAGDDPAFAGMAYDTLGDGGQVATNARAGV